MSLDGHALSDARISVVPIDCKMHGRRELAQSVCATRRRRQIEWNAAGYRRFRPYSSGVIGHGLNLRQSRATAAQRSCSRYRCPFRGDSDRIRNEQTSLRAARQ
jgi:hypothetical protein